MSVSIQEDEGYFFVLNKKKYEMYVYFENVYEILDVPDESGVFFNRCIYAYYVMICMQFYFFLITGSRFLYDKFSEGVEIIHIFMHENSK